jgi:hypothetical protein
MTQGSCFQSGTSFSLFNNTFLSLYEANFPIVTSKFNRKIHSIESCRSPPPTPPSPPTQPAGSSWGLLQYGALDLPRVHKTTYAPVIYTTLCIMFWKRGYTLLGEVGGGWALEFPSFLGLKWHSPIGLMPFHRAQPPPTSPRNVYPHLQNIMHGRV